MMSRQRGSQPLRRVVVVALATSWLLVGCAAMSNTLTQDLAWERWKKCDHFTGLRLDRIDTEGQIWVTYGDGFADLEPWRACLRQAALEQGKGAQTVKTRVIPSAAASQSTKEQTPAANQLMSAPTWKLGDEWAYRWESPRGSGTFVWSVDREEVLDGVPFYIIKSGTTRELYVRKNDLAFYMDRVNGQVEARYTPAAPFMPSPFQPGVTWELRYTYERPLDRQTEDLIRACESSGPERVTVPGGTFDTVKTTCRDGRSGAIVYEAWYSLAVKQMVRERSLFPYGIRDRELITFRLH